MLKEVIIVTLKFQNIFIIPKETTHPLNVLYDPSSQPLASIHLHAVFMDWLILDISCKWNHGIYGICVWFFKWAWRFQDVSDSIFCNVHGMSLTLKSSTGTSQKKKKGTSQTWELLWLRVFLLLGEVKLWSLRITMGRETLHIPWPLDLRMALHHFPWALGWAWWCDYV